MNYWHMQLHPDNKDDFPPAKIKQILEEKGVVGLGKENSGAAQFQNSVKIGDLILVRSDRFRALVKVESQSWVEGNVDWNLDWFDLRRKVSLLGFSSDYEDYLPRTLGRAYLPATFAPCNAFNGANASDYTIGDYIDKWHTIIKQEEKMKELNNTVEILKQKKQLILQGAPGTGKTFISAEIALKLIGEDTSSLTREALMKLYNVKVKSGQIAFTTFHQSVDYEEFVEGLKPVLTNDEKISYQVKPGVFKSMCDTANNKNIQDAVHDIFETFNATRSQAIIDVKGVDYHTEYVYPQLHIHCLKTVYYIDYNSLNNEFSWRQSGVSGEQGRCKLDDLFTSVSEDCTDLPKHKIQSIINEVLVKYSSTPYVLIVDEINRGNISKILGELITLLEADKRLGATNEITVKLPYTHTENPDAPEFGVPSNLFIIGTMNTADRSVGHIDYAIRRRFAFVTLKSDITAIEGYYNGKDLDLKNSAIALFDQVEKIFGYEEKDSNGYLSPEFDKHDLMIGHSYFMAEDLDKLKLKLEFEIRPLLIEYQKDGILKESAKDSIRNLAI